MIPTALAGFGLGLSLIAAIGAQNAFVLRQGIRREHVVVVVLICLVSDAVLMGVGVAGGGALFTSVPVLAEIARWAGAAFLLVYAALAVRRAIRPGRLQVDARDAGPADEPVGTPDDSGRATSTSGATSAAISTGATSSTDATSATGAASSPGATAVVAAPARPRTATAASVALTALALTWLNPHVYLDTLVLIGSIASGHGDQRWIFGIGAWTASIVWFVGLGFGARLLAPLFAKPIAWRVLDLIVAAVMATLAVTLVVH
nr:LysE family transporter [Schumannella sp. 10F1B-5-1]